MSKAYMMRYVLFMRINTSFSTVYRRFTKFNSGQESVKDAPYSERPRFAATKNNINKIQSIIEKDARFTVRQLAQM